MFCFVGSFSDTYPANTLISIIFVEQSTMVYFSVG